MSLEPQMLLIAALSLAVGGLSILFLWLLSKVIRIEEECKHNHHSAYLLSNRVDEITKYSMEGSARVGHSLDLVMKIISQNNKETSDKKGDV